MADKKKTVTPAAGDKRWPALLGLLALAVVLAWFWHNPLLFPLRILVVLFHELGHGLVAVATGGEVVSIALSPDEGGLCVTRGGWRFLILNGGYLGSLVFGVLLLLLARARGAARGVVFTLGLLVLGASLAFVRPLVSFGFGYGLLAGLVLVGVGLKAPVVANWWLLRLLGVFSVLYALLDVRDDVFRATGAATSDAAMLAEMTHIPGFVWGGAWILAGLLLLFLLRKRLA
ncbi:MAG: M50 family metallopeptidase [Pseudomonadota bacterium]